MFGIEKIKECSDKIREIELKQERFDLTEIKAELKTLRTEIAQLKPISVTNFEDRLTSLETKFAKFWVLISEQTPTGKDKLSKTGKKLFGGANKGY